ncbi:MAG TPA: (deoxy)nucleoside triphosphate pyrophosphohydrolase [Bacteroidota bacterium]|nr:(deoxy)nucleoside triphosphate pyrophosphohydrolase [Bacteroidota bacterium]
MNTVAVGIVSLNGAILLCQRREGGRYGLKWEFPGGKAENGETPEECLIRELREELSIVPVVGSLFHRHQHRYPDGGEFDVYYFTVSSFTGTPANRVFASLAWVPPAELSGYDLLEGNREVARRLLEAHGSSQS